MKQTTHKINKQSHQIEKIGFYAAMTLSVIVIAIHLIVLLKNVFS